MEGGSEREREMNGGREGGRERGRERVTSRISIGDFKNSLLSLFNPLTF